MRPRTLGKAVIIVLLVLAILAAVIYARKDPDPSRSYIHTRAVTAAILALTFATLYRYFED